MSKKRVLTAQSTPDTDEDWKRVIGNIYLNLPRLYNIYKKERYDNEGNLNEDWNLFDYLQKTWDDVSLAMGNNHTFKLSLDSERPDVARVIDLVFQKEDNLTEDKLHTIKIQSNETVCRDFAYHSEIPTALSTTIAISVQNPDNIDTIESATWAALSRNVKSRHHVPKKLEHSKTPSANEIEEKEKLYDKLLSDIRDQIDTLFEHRVKIMQGKYEKVDEDGNNNNAELVGRMSATLQDTYAKILNEKTKYPWTDTGADPPYYTGFFKAKDNIPSICAVIPLKFTATFDGISGIVIGHVFKIDPTRLPKQYQMANVAFVVTKEEQVIKAGGDWETKIEGQMMMLPGDKEDLGEYEPRLGRNFFDEEKGVNYVGNTKAGSKWTYHGIITKEQQIIPPDMELVDINSPVYHKIGKQEKNGTNVRVSSKVDNESYWDFGEDNVIGMINPGSKGTYLGKVRKITHQETLGNCEWSEKDQAYMMENENGVMVKAETLTNLTVPWYLIQFDYTNPEFYKNWNLGANREWNNVLDMNGAGWWKYWFNNANPPGWDWGYGCDWWQKRSLRGEDPFLTRNSSETGNSYDTPGNVLGLGWMRIDTLQANAAYGFSREENITRIARAMVVKQSGIKALSTGGLSPSNKASYRADQILKGWNDSEKTIQEQGAPNSMITTTEISGVLETEKKLFNEWAEAAISSGKLYVGPSNILTKEDLEELAPHHGANYRVKAALAELYVSSGFSEIQGYDQTIASQS
tara:strand:- start:1432 stop:3672 length:2241 start_codon:yes stop_codon:yes gene_type:complete